MRNLIKSPYLQRFMGGFVTGAIMLIAFQPAIV